MDHIEDRIVGLKVRDLYEVPAAEMILTAHKELEKLVGTIHQNRFKPALDEQWAFLVYAGLWYEPLLENLNAFMDSVNEQVTGKITLQLYRGSCKAVRRESPNALYDAELASFGESGGLFSQQSSPGFIELWTLQSRMAYGIRNRKKDEGRGGQQQRVRATGSARRTKTRSGCSPGAASRATSTAAPTVKHRSRVRKDPSSRTCARST